MIFKLFWMNSQDHVTRWVRLWRCVIKFDNILDCSKMIANPHLENSVYSFSILKCSITTVESINKKCFLNFYIFRSNVTSKQSKILIVTIQTNSSYCKLILLQIHFIFKDKAINIIYDYLILTSNYFMWTFTTYFPTLFYSMDCNRLFCDYYGNARKLVLPHSD